ncbi:hypothetical protein ACIOHE_00615 [Streptomyces sp. NPDC087851]|uniref:hypothetical protein n=1 Tax=Streptomyces sp. NPDC087851 TaxID=3365810 RepID=UPI00382ECC66
MPFEGLPLPRRRQIGPLHGRREVAIRVAGATQRTASAALSAARSEEGRERVGLEVVRAHDADKLECLIQAVEFGERGCANVQGWVDSSLAKLKTASAQALTEARFEHDLGGMRWSPAEVQDSFRLPGNR